MQLHEKKKYNLNTLLALPPTKKKLHKMINEEKKGKRNVNQIW